MKKIINIILCICLLLQNFAFAIPVLAEEVKDPIVKIKDVKQGERSLTKVDDNYIVDGYEQVYIEYEVENYDKTKKYRISSGIENYGWGTGQYRGSNIEYVNLNFHQEINKYYIGICKDKECDEFYSKEYINFKIAYYDEMKNSNIYITEIKQGGKKVEPVNNTFEFNKSENIEISLLGSNLLDDAYYTISTGNHLDNSKFLGSEIEKGITITHYTNMIEYFGMNFSLENSYQGNGINNYYDGENYYWCSFNFTSDDTKPSYDGYLFYSNYEDIKVQRAPRDYAEYYVINSNYANKENPLAYKVNANKFEDKDYEVFVTVKQGDKQIYNNKKTVNGLLLNEGYTFEFDDLELELNKKLERESEPYKFLFDIGYIHSEVEAKYNSIGKDAMISCNIYFENGKKNLSAFRGDGNLYFSSGIFDTNKDVFNKYSSIYLSFIGSELNEDEEYDYVLEYGDFFENELTAGTNYEIELTKGKVTGKTLSTIGLLFNVDNYKNYENPTYRLTLKKGDEILYSDAPVLYIVNSPTLANASLKANNKNLFIQTSNSSYIATRNAPIDIMISGLGFDDEKTYNFEYCYASKDDEKEWYDEPTCKKIDIKGKDLNKGNAKIKFEEKVNEEVKAYNFYVYCDLQESFVENVAIQGGFDIYFVDSKELLPESKDYIVDNVDDLIKNIKKNTSAKDFAESITVIDNGKVKIYDNTGKNEVKGNVGTGMIARVVNEYDENVLDLDIVVKGDTSGDGNISITDLVKVKQHVAEINELTGVYEVAANVTDSGEVSITDLVKISQDVAGIKEVE